MEKKSTKLFLGVMLLSVWSIFGYRLYERKNKPNTTYPTTAISKQTAVATEREAFALLLNYKDPFVPERSTRSRRTNVSVSQKRKVVASKRSQPQKKVKKKKVPFPKIEYKGNVKMVSGQRKAIVKMDNDIHHWRSGERKDELLLERIFDDSIQVRFQDMVEVIAKAE